ncbi:hypothetical protein GSH16_15080 [Rhodobacteraceae bacterium KN286]|uniref:Probable branched-chain-amino-acid aminotransferase n=2 Tax=Oceanomicrobium pacificus TaxID=2692916 RepID=A0A6B0U7C3_9RHOB|nr:hypothetical protein [Oceanomicrobium pacificus]
MRREPDGTIPRRALHRGRLCRSAAALGIETAPERFDAAVDAHPSAGTAERVRLTLDRAGRFAVTVASAPEAARLWTVALHSERLDARDPWLQVKTSERHLYDRARAALPDGVDEYLFANRDGNLAEGTITNIFVDLGQGLVTPPLSNGCLPGILRAELLETGQVRAAPVPIEALKDARALYVGNSLRGLVRARLQPMDG